jgi:hypothetical protein
MAGVLNSGSIFFRFHNYPKYAQGSQKQGDRRWFWHVVADGEDRNDALNHCSRPMQLQTVELTEFNVFSDRANLATLLAKQRGSWFAQQSQISALQQTSPNH